MLTHAIQSDIVMICARVMQRKKSDKKKRVSCYDFCIKISILFDLFCNGIIIHLETYCKYLHCITNTFVLEHFLNWCVPYGYRACESTLLNWKRNAMRLELIYKAGYLTNMHRRFDYNVEEIITNWYILWVFVRNKHKFDTGINTSFLFHPFFSGIFRV